MMTTPHNPHQEAADTAAGIEDLQAEISSTLTDLDALVPLIDHLTRSHQRGLGFLTPAGKHAVDNQLRDERHDRRTQPGRDLGLKFLNRESSVAGTGDVPAPGTLSALTVEATITLTLRDLVRRVVRRLSRAGVCTLHQMPAESTSRELTAHLRNLCWSAPSPSLLAEVLRELEHLVEAATLVVDGNDRTQLGDCPHCGRPTLTVYFRDEVIRCDKDPVSGHFQACRCSDPYCDCKQKPISFRHSWWRVPRNAPDPRLAHDWHDLAGRLNLKRAIQKEPTR